MRHLSRSLLALAVVILLGSASHAASILHVDTGGEVDHQAKGVASVLEADGHTVTSILTTGAAFAALQGALGAYDLVIWDNWSNSDGAEIANLTSYVTGGGFLLAIGYDSIYQSGMSDLLGGTGASDTTIAGSSLDPVANVVNSLTVGIADIRGLTPVGVSSAFSSNDLDSLLGLGGDTTAVVTSSFGTHWTLRTLGAGEVAFMSTPFSFDFASDDAVYRDGLRNIAYNAVPEPSTAASLGLGLCVLALRSRRVRERAAPAN